MRNAIALALVLASTPVSAQPVTTPCAVTIARAPDDVRIIVDAWVAAETSCSTALEVRIVPTEGGLYVLARDEHGRVRERIVPDAQSAGVLIASWAADDVIAAPPPGTPAPEPAPAEPAIAPTPPPDVGPSSAPEVAPTGAPSMMGPSMAPGAISVGSSMPVDAPPAPPPLKRPSKWVSVAALTGDGRGGGLRVELDVLTRGKWSFGLAASSSYGYGEIEIANAHGDLNSADKKLTMTATRNMQHGRWQLRASAGLGIVYTDIRAVYPSSPVQPDPYVILEASGAFGVVDGSLLGGVELGKHWAITGGPIMTVYSQDFEAQSAQMTGPTMMSRRNIEVMGYLGLRYRL